MSDETKIIQKSAPGSDTTQIGEQNNYYGMTAEEAKAYGLIDGVVVHK